MSLQDKIRSIPDYPKQGIVFRDITTLFQDPDGLKECVDQITAAVADWDLDAVAGIEARGFITGALAAMTLGLGFIPIRKKGKLPAATYDEEYALEYGTDQVEIHRDGIKAGQRVLVVDDLIATGGTAMAGAKLIERAQGTVAGFSFIIDLPDLGGCKRLRDAGYRTHCLMEFADG